MDSSPSTEPQEFSLADERLDELLDEWEELRERGEEFDVQRLDSLEPGLAEAFLRAVDDLKRFESLDADLANPGGNPDPLRIGPYQVEKRLAEGGSSVVYACRQRVPNRLIAVKVLRPEAVSARRIRRFRIEAELLATLAHPGIVQVHGAGVVRLGMVPQPYLCMEFVRGRRLDEFVEGTLPPGADRVEPVLRLFLRIADALSFAHQQGIVHRDLKPSNILVDEHGEPKIIDFGLARLRTPESTAGPHGTVTCSPAGTPPYMSPEQFQDDSGLVDARSDLYSLAVVLFEMLAGQLPYALQGQPYVEMARRVRESAPRPLRGIHRQFDPGLEAVLQTALAKDPRERYQSAAEFAADLRRVLLGQPVKAARVGPLRQLWTWGRHNPRSALASGLIAALLAVSAVTSAFSALWAASRSRALEASLAELRREQARTVGLASELGDRNEELRQTNARLVASAGMLQRTATNATLLRVGSLVDSDPTLARSLLFDEALCPPGMRGIAWRMLEGRTRRERVDFRASDFSVSQRLSVDFAAQGALVVTTSPGLVRWWNSQDGSLKYSIEEGIGNHSRVAADPQSELAVVLREDGVVFLASPGKGVKQRIHEAEPARGTAIACAAGGRFVAVGDEAGAVHLWGEDRAAPRRQWRLDDTPVAILGFSQDGERCAAVSLHGAVGMWDVRGEREAERGKFPALQVTDGKFSPDLRLVCGVTSGGIVTWDRVRSQLVSQDTGAKVAAWLPNDPPALLLATRSHVHRVPPAGDRTLLHAHRSQVQSLAAAADGSRIALASADGGVSVLAIHSLPESPRRFPPVNAPYLIRYSNDGQWLAIAHENTEATHAIRILQLPGGELRAEYRGLASRTDDLAFSEDGRTLVYSGRYGPVQVCDFASGNPPRSIESPGDRVTSLALSSDGGRLYAGERTTGAVLDYDLASGNLRRRLDESKANCRAVKLYQGGRSLLSAHGQGDLCSWNTETGELDWRTHCGVLSIREICLSPDESLLAIAVQRGSPTVWRMSGRGIEPLATLRSDSSRAMSLAFSPDGTVLAAGDQSGQLQVWDTITWQPQLALSRPETPISCVGFSPDGRSLVLCARDGLEVWDLSP